MEPNNDQSIIRHKTFSDTLEEAQLRDDLLLVSSLPQTGLLLPRSLSLSRRPKDSYASLLRRVLSHVTDALILIKKGLSRGRVSISQRVSFSLINLIFFFFFNNTLLLDLVLLLPSLSYWITSSAVNTTTSLAAPVLHVRFSASGSRSLLTFSP
jgi:hypothetical protein